MENQTKSRRNQSDYTFHVHPRPKNRTQPKTVWRDSKSISSSEISKYYFRLPTHFQKALRGHQYQIPPFKATRLSRSILARKTEPNLKQYGGTLKVYPQVRFLRITFDSQLTFRKHFEDINTRYHRSRLLGNRKWEHSPSTLIQIYKKCVQTIFE